MLLRPAASRHHKQAGMLGVVVDADAAGRVLVVDDEPQVCRLMARLLERAGYQVMTADTDSQAMALLDEHGPFDVWLIDATVAPRGAGDLLQRAAATDPRPGLVLASGDWLDDAMQRDLEACGGVFLRKPFAPDRLALVMDEARRIAG